MNKVSLTVAGLLVFACFAFCQTSNQYQIEEYNNLSYVEKQLAENDSLQQLNLVLPTGTENYPVLIWIGGGAWSYGNKDMEMHFARRLGSEGIAVASVQHRLSPAIWRDSTMDKGIRHPKHVEDIASSVKWLVNNASKYGYAKDKIFIGGYSSGAHLAALICLDSTYLFNKGVPSKVFKGIIPISGAYDITNYYEVFKSGSRPELAELHVQAVFGDTMEDLKNASPTNYLDNLSTPILLISDNTVNRYTELLEDRIKKTGFKNLETIYVPNLSHGELWKNLSHEDSSIWRKKITNFIKVHSSKE